MEAKRLIFDLDGTLISWCPEYLTAFKKVLAEYHVDLDYHRQGEFASTYEKYYPNFNFPDMQQHFYHTVGLNVPLSFFEKYLQYLGKISKKDEKLCELLAELEQSYELVVLTNWFKSSQLDLGMPAIYIEQKEEKINVPTIANIYEIRKVLKR